MINLLIIMKCLDIPFNDHAQYMLLGKNVYTLSNINIHTCNKTEERYMHFIDILQR